MILKTTIQQCQGLNGVLTLQNNSNLLNKQIKPELKRIKVLVLHILL